MEDIGLDHGLASLFATDQGDLLGQGFLARLKHLEGLLQPLVRHLQRSGLKPRQSARYRDLVQRIRGFVTTEVNRVLNRLVETRQPKHLVLERLDFRAPGLSARMNRLLQNCGRGVIRAKLQDLEQRFGVTSEEVNPAYTSQGCSSCGYVDARNRREQARFRCLWCGLKLHADCNAGRNVRGRRSVLGHTAFGRGRTAALAEAVRRFGERWSNGRGAPPERGRKGRKGPPADPRWSNPYFAEGARVAKSLPGNAGRKAQRTAGKARQTPALVADALTQ